MNFNKIFQSKTFQYTLWGIGVLIVMFFIFKAGMIVGFKKADFSYKWGENYHRNFGGPRGGFLKNFSGKDLIDGHGTFGKIIKIEKSLLTIKGPNDIEKAVKISEKTIIKHFMDNIKPTDLKTDDLVVVIGKPNNTGQIEAELIRLMPPPPPPPSFK